MGVVRAPGLATPLTPTGGGSAEAAPAEWRRCRAGADGRDRGLRRVRSTLYRGAGIGVSVSSDDLRPANDPRSAGGRFEPGGWGGPGETSETSRHDTDSLLAGPRTTRSAEVGPTWWTQNDRGAVATARTFPWRSVFTTAGRSGPVTPRAETTLRRKRRGSVQRVHPSGRRPGPGGAAGSPTRWTRPAGRIPGTAAPKAFARAGGGDPGPGRHSQPARASRRLRGQPRNDPLGAARPDTDDSGPSLDGPPPDRRRVRLGLASSAGTCATRPVAVCRQLSPGSRREWRSHILLLIKPRARPCQAAQQPAGFALGSPAPWYTDRRGGHRESRRSRSGVPLLRSVREATAP